MSGRGGTIQPGTVAAADAGFTLIEVLFTIALGAVLTAAAMPLVTATAERSRAAAATRYLAARMNLARAMAVARSATIAFQFEETAGGVKYAVYVDGNQNGVRTSDIDAGLDRPLGQPEQLNEIFPGVIVTLPAGIRLFSFTASGTATSGTIGIQGRDGSRFAVRVLGATGRTRALRYDPASSDFVEGV